MQAKAGKTKFVIGSGKNMMDFTYVGNVAQAHVQVCNIPGRLQGPQRCLLSWPLSSMEHRCRVLGKPPECSPSVLPVTLGTNGQ